LEGTSVVELLRLFIGSLCSSTVATQPPAGICRMAHTSDRAGQATWVNR